MKKSIAIGIIVTVVIGLIAAIPVFAARPGGIRAVWESDIVPTHQGVLAGFDLEKSEAYIRLDGSFKVELVGVTGYYAEEGTDFEVYFRHGVGMAEQDVYLGALILDEDGNAELTLNLFTDVSGINVLDGTIRAPMIRIYDDDLGWKAFFASGFYVE